MPSEKMIRERGGVVRIRTKRLSDGSLMRIYVFRKPGPDGGKTWAEKLPTKARK